MKKEDMKTEWDLSGLFYEGIDDPRFEEDIRKMEVEYEAFRAAYEKDDVWLADDEELFKALSRYEGLFGSLPLTAPSNYLYCRLSLDSDDKEASAKNVLLAQRMANTSTKLVFFELRLARLPQKRRAALLSSPRFERFRYFLKNVFEHAKHDLSEAEERIMALKSLPSYDMWVEGTEKVLHRETIAHKGKKLPFAEALDRVRSLPEKERGDLHRAIVSRMKALSDFAEHELNAIVVNKKISDELRHYPEPYSSTLLGNQNEEATIDALRKAVEAAIGTSHRFFKLKAKLHGKKSIRYEDRNASIGSVSERIPFPKGASIVRSAFGKAEARFGETLDRYLENGQIDVFPKKGKRNGAFCLGNVNAPTFVFLNYVGDLNSVMTMAHEMGHALHTDFSSAAQSPLYRGYSTASAEVASTLFENFAFEEVYETLSDDEKIVALHDRINDDMQTIFRQIACFNFELEMHRAIREKGALSKEELAALMVKHLSWYLGPAVKVAPDDGYAFVMWNHLRYYFYVYTYAFGQLVSKAMYASYRADKSFVGKIIEFLRSGGSASPEDIFKSIGIDVSDPGFWERGLREIDRDIDRLEALAAKR